MIKYNHKNMNNNNNDFHTNPHRYNMEYFASNHHESVCSSDIDSGGGELMIVVPNAMRNNLIGGYIFVDFAI